MIRYISASFIGFLLCGSACGSTVQDLSALHGCWRGTAPGGVLQESWSAVSAGVMFGTDQLLDPKASISLGWDTMTIISGESDIQFGFAESGAAQQIFNLSEMKGTNGNWSATFAKASTTGVNRVMLTLTASQSLRIQLFGHGSSAGLDLVLQRISATADCP